MEECIFANDSTVAEHDSIVDLRVKCEEKNITTAGIRLSVQVADVGC